MRSQQNCSITACRRGAVSAMVIVVLLILLGMLVAHVRLTLNERRQMQNELHYQQTLELAKAVVLLVRVIRMIRPGQECVGKLLLVRFIRQITALLRSLFGRTARGKSRPVTR